MKKENNLNSVKETLDALKNAAKSVRAKATTYAKKRINKTNDVSFYIQYQGKEVCKQTIIEKVHKEWTKSHKLSEIITLEIYLKVEEDTAYCLINGDININIKLF